MTEYFYLIADCGDGSCGVHWFKTKELAEKLVDKEDTYWNNEGWVSSIFAKDLRVTFREDTYIEDEGE